MKLYLHHEGKPPLTTIFKSDDHLATTAQLAEFFAGKYNSIAPTQKIHPSTITVKNSNGKVIQQSILLTKVFKNLDDAYMDLLEHQSADCPTAPSASVAQTSHRKERKVDDKPVSATGWTIVESLVSRGEEFEKEKKFRGAVSCYEQVFSVLPEEKSALAHLLAIWLKVGRPEMASTWCEKALKYHSDDPQILKAVGDIRHACGKYSEALQMYDRVLELIGQSDNPAIPVKDVKLATARSLYALGKNRQFAAKLVMEVVEPDNSHPGGLLEYAKIAYEKGMFDAATQVLLRVMKNMEDDEETKKYMALCLEEEDGLKTVMSELKEGLGVGSAYAFVAGKVKDYGAINVTLQLYLKALEFEPLNTSFALNYLHTLEIKQDFMDVLEFARGFCERMTGQMCSSIDEQEVVAALKGIDALFRGARAGTHLIEPWDPMLMARRAAEDDVEDIVQKVDMTNFQLDFLALIFTITKVLFVVGALARLAKLVDAVELMRKASKKELVTTLIRNEAAYFGCISQIMWDHPPPAIDPGQCIEPLFLCGDSHCLSGAWRHVLLRKQKRLLVPKLVTGCKIWHLREEGKFYPKANFENSMRTIPDGSQVIMMFGEIDCREGIMLAVEKLKYDTDDQAMVATATIYIKVLRQLIADRKFEIFVHPISPVLDVTRPTVSAFMKVLKRMIVVAIRKHSLKGKLHWLEFFQELVCNNGTSLNPDIDFDGTHMSPEYVQFLDGALKSID